MKYQSGEEIREGDRVLFHGEPGEIEFVVEGLVGDPVKDWHMEDARPGVMVLEPKVFGRCFLSDTEEAEDLILVSRKSETEQQIPTSD